MNRLTFVFFGALLAVFSSSAVPCMLYDQAEPVDLPEVLRTFDGRTVTDVGTWETLRRPEIIRFLERNVYGLRPVERPADLKFSQTGADEVVLDGRAVRKRMCASFSGPRGVWRFGFYAFIPSSATAESPVASFLLICNRNLSEWADPELKRRSEFFPVEKIIGRGYAALVFKNTELASDSDDYRPHLRPDGSVRHFDPDFTNGFYACWAERRTETSWGAISAWAWGASRVMDWIETEARLDAGKVAVVGHSRGGKTSLWAAASDERFALACVNNSGCCGAKLNHVAVPLSETIGQDNNNNPHWFARSYRRFNGRDFLIPFDQHWIVALVAPRLIYIASASYDTGAGPWGEFLTARCATEVWELYGAKGLVENHLYAVGRPFHEGRIGYHLRKGEHDLKLEDWNNFMDFADRHGWRAKCSGPTR